MPARLTTEAWITRARAVHDDRYDYSKVVYDRAHLKVTIVCEIHGEFRQIARDHVNAGVGCLRCGGTARLSTDEYISMARAVHGERYDYGRVEYMNSKTNVTIVCRVHGSFQQEAGVHLRGHGCSRCGNAHSPTTEEWIRRARAVHGERYDYSSSEYSGSKADIVITCYEHGEFKQRPVNHVNRGHGCPRCSERHKPTTEEWIRRARAIHGERYDIRGSSTSTIARRCRSAVRTTVTSGRCPGRT